MPSLARLHLAYRPYQPLTAFLTNPNPLVGRAGRWLATIQTVNNRGNYYAAINLVNYTLTQAVCKQEHNPHAFFPFSFSAFLNGSPHHLRNKKGLHSQKIKRDCILPHSQYHPSFCFFTYGNNHTNLEIPLTCISILSLCVCV